MSAIDDIAAERRRQIEVEGWTLAHDDKHTDQSLAMAAALYAAPVPLFKFSQGEGLLSVFDPWPWWHHEADRDPQSRGPGRSKAWDKRQKFDRRRALVVAGALILAEIERLDRLALPA